MKFFGVALFLIVLLSSQELVMQSEALRGICKVPSKTFRGICVGDTTCIVKCKSEGHAHGECSHFRRRCECLRTCAAEAADQIKPETAPETTTPKTARKSLP